MPHEPQGWPQGPLTSGLRCQGPLARPKRPYTRPQRPLARSKGDSDVKLDLLEILFGLTINLRPADVNLGAPEVNLKS